MVKAPVNLLSPDQKQVQGAAFVRHPTHHHHYAPSPGSGSSHASHSNNNNHHKKHRRTHMATESPGEVLAAVPVVASGPPGSSSGTIVVTTMAVNVSGAPTVSVPPIVAVVAPTTSTGGGKQSGSRQQAAPFLYHALPIPIPTTQAQAGAWPLVEPVFHFGPGFERRQVCPAHSTTSQNSSEHTVYFHVSPGVSVTFQVGSKHEVVAGPVTVPMVSQSGSPPIPMPVQVPPGHVMQQIVDENGTLRHVILSTAQPHNLQQQSGVQPHNYAAPFITANGTTPYYSHLQTGFPSPGQHFHPAAMAPVGSSNGASGAAGTTQPPPQQQHLQPQPQITSHSPHSPSPPNNIYLKDERSQRQHAKLVRKLDKQKTRDMNSTVSTPTHSPSPRKNELNGVGMIRRHQRSNGTSSVGTSEDGEESSSVPDEEDDAQAIIEQLSLIQAPTIADLTNRSALLQWTMPPSSENVTLNFNDLEFEILLADRGKDGRYKQLFKGQSLSCRIQDLSPGKEYACILQVYMGDQHCYASEPAVFCTPRCEPNSPSDIKLSARTKSSLQLKWNPPADNGAPIMHYILESDYGKNNGEFVEVCKTKNKSYNYTKLQPATAYHFRLAAVNEVGKSAYSPVVRHETAMNAPLQPQPPFLQHSSSSTLRLGWQRRPSDEDYILQMMEFGSTGYFNMYDGPETTYECAGLRRATSFQFRLKAKNEAGTSPWSNEVVFRTLPECPGRPPKPQVKGKIHATNFRVRWDPPADRGGADIKCYYLEISSGANFEPVYCGAETEAVCDRLSPGTTYQLRVICEGPAGSSGFSDYSTVTTEPVVPGPPPTPVLANQPGPYACVLRWEKPDYNGGTPVTSYEVEVQGVSEPVYSGKDLYCVVKDLLPGETYVVKVRAVNRIGSGPWSDSFTFKTAAAPPHIPAPPSVTVKSPTQLSVSWQEPPTNGSAVTEYRLEYSHQQSETGPATPTHSSAFLEGFSVAYQGPNTSTDVKNLTPASLYLFRLCASNSAGTSPFSQMTRQQTPPAPPGVPVFGVYEKSACDIRLTWEVPECNGAPILYYNIDVGADRGVLSTPHDGSTDFLIDQLHAETTYKIRIQAVNRVGTGTFSSYIKITTLPLPPRPPKLECAQIGFNFIKLRWVEEKPKNTQLDIVKYHVEMQNNRTKEFTNVYSGTRNVCKINKLHELQDYTFRIFSETESAGQGDYSEEFVFSTPAAVPNSIKAPRVVVGETTDGTPAAESAQLTLEWQQSKNNAFNDRVDYLLEMSRTKSEQDFKEVYHGPETRYTLTQLEYDVEYSFRVCSIRVMGSESVPGTFSTVLHHTISQPEDTNSDTVDATSPSVASFRRDVTTAHYSGDGSGIHQNVLFNMVEHVLSAYRNRDKFTDQQKAMIYVAVLMVAALVCAAIVEMFLR